MVGLLSLPSVFTSPLHIMSAMEKDEFAHEEAPHTVNLAKNLSGK